jgi:hypothetical protein
VPVSPARAAGCALPLGAEIATRVQTLLRVLPIDGEVRNMVDRTVGVRARAPDSHRGAATPS